jgi:hypothetical protein
VDSFEIGETRGIRLDVVALERHTP